MVHMKPSEPKQGNPLRKSKDRQGKPCFSLAAAVRPHEWDRMLNRARYGCPWLVWWTRLKRGVELWAWDVVQRLHGKRGLRKYPVDHGPLCYRCEYRAQYHETGVAPRCECGGPGAVCGCYMYRPVRPLETEADPGDKRPLGGPWMISARSHATGLADFEPVAHRRGRKLTIYWRPKGE